MKELQTFLKKVRNSNITLIVISLLLSVLTWAVVKINFSDTTTKTLTNVKVNLDASLAEENSFYPFCSDESLQVDVQVIGKSYDLNSKAFSAGDIILEASSGYVDSSGYKVMNVTATTTNPDITVASVSPSTLTVFFDRRETRTFNVEARLDNDPETLVSDGYILGKPAPSFSTVDVEGPATVIANLNKVIFSAEADKKSLPLKETKELPAIIEFDLENERGKDFLVCRGIGEDGSEATVTVPISEIRTVPTSVQFVNQPAGFDSALIPVSISPESVEVSLTSNEETLDSVIIGTIDFRELSAGKNTFSFDAKNTGSYSFVEDIASFEVTADLSSFSTKTLKGIPSNIVFTGQASGKSYSVSETDKGLSGIVIVGPAASLGKITEDSLQVEVNVSKIEDGDSRTRCKVSNIIIPSSDDCWVYGNYYCHVSVEG